jgi:hypothetical protein
MTTEELER